MGNEDQLPLYEDISAGPAEGHKVSVAKKLGHVWLCPHRVMSYKHLQGLRTCKPPDAGQYYSERVDACGNECCANRMAQAVIHDARPSLNPKETLDLHSGLVLCRIPLTAREDVFTAAKWHVTPSLVRSLTHPLARMPMCRHMSMAQAGQCFDPDHLEVRDKDWRSLRCNVCFDAARGRYGIHFMPCSKCDGAWRGVVWEFYTEFRFSVVEVGGHGEKGQHLRRHMVLILEVVRHLGSPALDGNAWACHALDMQALERMPTAWHSWNRLHPSALPERGAPSDSLLPRLSFLQRHLDRLRWGLSKLRREERVFRKATSS